MEEFIFAEQVLNNFDLYKGTDRENAFKMNLKPDFLPENQNTFSLPYFLIPIDSDLILYKKNEEKFFDDNLFLSKNGKIYYPFFVHPETVDFFVSWLNGKYDFIDGDDSIYNATPTSSYRSLLVTNLKTNVWSDTIKVQYLNCRKTKEYCNEKVRSKFQGRGIKALRRHWNQEGLRTA